MSHGPQGWIAGEGGHSYFRAKIELGLRAVPRCPKTHLQAQFWSTSVIFQNECHARVDTLYREFDSPDLSIADGLNIIEGSPFFQASNWLKWANQNGHRDSVQRIQKDKFSRKAYTVLFDHYHHPGATCKRIKRVFIERWVPLSGLASEHPLSLNVDKSIRALKWLASKVPPRVHNANVRLQLNAFHTARRYQHENRCLFCNHIYSDDSLEHILVCKEIQTVFSQHLLEGSPPRLPLGYWFLQRGPPSTQILMGCIVCLLFTSCITLSGMVAPKMFLKTSCSSY